MALCYLERINYGRKWPVSIKYKNLHSFKEGLVFLSQSILETKRITHLHGSAHFTIPLNPCLWLYYYDKIAELEKNTNNKRHTVYGACNLTKLHFKILIYLFLIPNVWAIFSLRDHHKITSVTLNTFCSLSKPSPHNHLFLMNKTKLDGIPSKNKWKIHVLSYTVVPRFWRCFL